MHKNIYGYIYKSNYRRVYKSICNMVLEYIELMYRVRKKIFVHVWMNTWSRRTHWEGILGIEVNLYTP